jgi:DNA-binding transcriptional LysR family regulator
MLGEVSLAALNLNLLVALEALLGEQHLTRAARRLGLSQPAMSNALARLRRLLGDPLFVRSGGRLAPTARAQALAAPVTRALADLRQLLRGPARFDPRRARRQFTLRASELAELTLAPPLAARLARSAPGVELRWLPAGRRPAQATLAAGEADLVLTDLARGPRRRHSLLVLRQPLVTLARVGARPGQSQPAQRLSHVLTAALIAANGDPVVTLPAVLARDLGRNLPLRRVAVPGPPALLHVGAFWHARDDDDPGHRWLRETLADVGRRLAVAP